MKDKKLRNVEIRKKAFLIKDTMPDDLFFSNTGFFTYLESSLRALLGDNPRNIRLHAFYEPEMPVVAYTDNKVVYINTGNNVTSSLPSRPKKYLSILGLILHEVGHIYYTDFPANDSYQKAVNNGRWYPKTPTNGKEIEEELKADASLQKLFCYIAHNLMNRVEDAYIELRITQRFHGLYEKGLVLLNQTAYEHAHTLSELFAALKEEKIYMLDIFLEQILLYAKCQDIKSSSQAKKEYPSEFAEFISVFSKVKPLVRKLRTERSAPLRWNYVNEILVLLWEYIKQRASTADNPADSSSLSSDIKVSEEACEEIIKELSKIFDESSCGSEPKGHTNPIGDKSSKSEIIHSGEESGAPATSPEDESDAESDLDKVTEDIATSELEKDLADELSKEIDKIGKKRYSQLVKEVEKLKEHKKKASLSSEEKETITVKIARKTSQAKFANDVQYYLNREPSIEPHQIEIYNTIMADMLPLSKALQRKVIPILRERNLEGKLSGLPMGKRFSAKLAYREDGKVFSKPLIPDGTPQLAIGVLIDESGSMYGSKIYKARQTAILVEDFLRNVEIPHIILGHTGDLNSSGAKFSVEMTSYVEFDSYDEADKYRLAKVEAQANNRDGAALAYIYERLLQRTEPRKLLLVITDGEPSARSYYGTPAINDSRDTVEDYFKKGIKTIALAIDGTISNIKEIYGEDKLIVVNDLADLPSVLTGILKRQILK